MNLHSLWVHLFGSREALCLLEIEESQHRIEQYIKRMEEVTKEYHDLVERTNELIKNG